MTTLTDTIKGTSGLIAYWPLINHTDQSGNGRHLTVVGSPIFNQQPLTSNIYPTMLTPNTGDTVRIDQSTLPKIRAIEAWFRLAGAKGGGIYSTVLSLNQPLSGINNRVILTYRDTLGFCTYQQINPTAGESYPSASHNWDELSVGSHHVVMQLNMAGTQTEVYIDGIKDPALTVPLDVFQQGAGQYLLLGSYIYNGSTNTAGNGQVGDAAIYDRPLTQAEITDRQQYKLGDPVIMPPVRITAIPANQETRAQFQPQDVVWRGSPGAVYAGPMIAPQTIPDVLCKGLDQAWIRDGVQNVLQGYIESTVTIDGEGVRRRVLCFDQAGNLVGETMSRASDGKYRFDLLWLNRRYMLVAQDDPAFGPADYNAVAADYQLPTPYAPGEGVGLA